MTENQDMDDEVNEFWLSSNNTFRLFSKENVDSYLSTLPVEKGINNVFRHVKCPNPISKAQVLDMSDEDIHLYLQMVADDEKSQQDEKK